eukprot:TRINITY_DN29665_c0_g1_i1.p2 TRINITY_DN29665_c0_g1~~TRINITY_DN29665_c0_g1_i1.p2  ORF type:complete len:102 (-),score=5.85 TRINITY_DN29665_c0_g1_i1:193-498(-)
MKRLHFVRLRGPVPSTRGRQPSVAQVITPKNMMPTTLRLVTDPSEKAHMLWQISLALNGSTERWNCRVDIGIRHSEFFSEQSGCLNQTSGIGHIATFLALK